MERMYCTHCGHQNAEDANYCANCGRPLSDVGDRTTGMMRPEDLPDKVDAGDVGEDAQALLSELEPSTALMVVVRGPNQGARFLLDKDTVTVGRHPESNIFLDDITVSRHHCRFVSSSESLVVEDSGSTNGTYVNGSRIDAVRLSAGDEVLIGRFHLLVAHGDV